jgi:hypothetical protein
MSAALDRWRGPSSEALDEIEGATRPSNQQLAYAFAVLLVAHFQLYCRSVHAEAAEIVASWVSTPRLDLVVETLLVRGRFLDRGNPTPQNLRRDFDRFDFDLWGSVEAIDPCGGSWKAKLGQLCEWRNAITHGDIGRKRATRGLVPRKLDWDTCEEWRRALEELVPSIDRAVATACQELGCPKPW